MLKPLGMTGAVARRTMPFPNSGGSAHPGPKPQSHHSGFAFHDNHSKDGCSHPAAQHPRQLSEGVTPNLETRRQRLAPRRPSSSHNDLQVIPR